MKPVYMDCHATTPVDPRAREAMLPYVDEDFGNAASVNHTFGWRAEKAVEEAREQVAELVGAATREIVFTSGATESNNLALKGVAEAHQATGRHIVSQPTEHKAILDTLAYLETRGFEVTYVPVDEYGRVSPRDVGDAIRDDTILISIMAANNEIGTIQPVPEIGEIAEKHGVLFHCDASQAVGKVPFEVVKDHVHIASFTAHKMYGPKGIGALYVRWRNPRVRLAPQMHGGGHERGFRSGTLNVAGIVGFGKAAEICRQERAEEAERISGLRDDLKARLFEALEDIHLNGHPDHRLPGNLHVSFDNVEAESVLVSMKEIAVSTGSACTTASVEPSHVLKALGLPEERAYSSIRFGLGRFNTSEEVEYVADRVIQTVPRLRQMTSVA